MKICLISDTHCQHGKLTIPECDLLIHAGDACGYGTEEEFRSFAIWFSHQEQAKNRIYVPGNHDRFVENYPSIAREMFSGGAVMLLDEMTTVEGLRIFGTPWTPEFCGWAFQGDDSGGRNRGYRDLERHFGMIPDCDILVCHGPILGIQDTTVSDERVGSIFLRKAVKRIKPKMFVCGHIHNGRGVVTEDDTIFVNASSCTEDYSTVREPIEVTL